MTDPKRFETIRDLVRDVAQVPPEAPMGPETDLVEDLGVDSLDLLNVFMRVQDDLGVVVDEEDVTRIKTLGDLCRYVDERAREHAA